MLVWPWLIVVKGVDSVKHHATFHTLENNIQTLNFFPVPLPRTPILCGNKKNSRHLKRTERDTLEYSRVQK